MAKSKKHVVPVDFCFQRWREVRPAPRVLKRP